jgi:hypothetical protein
MNGGLGRIALAVPANRGLPQAVIQPSRALHTDDPCHNSIRYIVTRPRARGAQLIRTVPADDDEAHFESLPVPLALWEPFQQCLSKHLSELTEGQIDREEKFWFDAVHVNAMIAVVEAEAVTAAPDLSDWPISLAAFARRAADRHVGVVFVIS